MKAVSCKERELLEIQQSQGSWYKCSQSPDETDQQDETWTPVEDTKQALGRVSHLSSLQTRAIHAASLTSANGLCVQVWPWALGSIVHKSEPLNWTAGAATRSCCHQYKSGYHHYVSSTSLRNLW